MTNKRKKLFFKLQYTGLHKLTTSISIGLVSETGAEFYAEFTDYDENQIDEFINENVLSKLILHDYDYDKHYNPDGDSVYVKGDTELIKSTLTKWLERWKEDGVEMWGDVYSYDWILFTGIFGNAFDVPAHVFYIPMDLATALKLTGEDPDVNREDYAYGEENKDANNEDKHNALFDARTQMEVYKKILAKMSTAGNESLDEESETTEEGEDATQSEEVVAVETVPVAKQPAFVEPTQAFLDQSEEFEPPI